MNFLCAAIDPEWNHVEQYGKGAVFDLSPDQHGWASYQHIKPGDIVYIIGQNRKVKAGFLVERVEDTEVAYRNSDLKPVRVVYSKTVVERPGISYEAFIKKHGIKDSKIDDNNQMMHGFNVVAF